MGGRLAEARWSTRIRLLGSLDLDPGQFDA
jgi:hypothetical protein